MNDRTEGATVGSPLRPFDRLPRRPWFLVPPLSESNDIGVATLTLHTIQSRDAYETLRRDGTLSGDPALGDADFAEAYDWMRRQMADRLPAAGNGILWLWAKTTFRDLIGNSKHARGEVLLTVCVPRERVLLSHFDDWHTVLNRGLEVPPLPGETFEQWEPRFEAVRDAWDERERPYRELPLDDWPIDLRFELETSWASIFDLDHREEPSYVQATVHELHAEEIVRAVRIL